MTITAEKPQLTHAARAVQNDDGTVSVKVDWTRHDAPLDRTDGSGWRVKDMKLANRLIAAIEAGVIIQNPTINIDINGNNYVSATHSVLARTLNADLKRLGF